MRISPINFLPIPGVTPMDPGAFLTPQEKYLAAGGGQNFNQMAGLGGGASPQAPAAGGVPGQGGGAAPTTGAPAGSGMMDAIMKLFMSGMAGV